MTQIDKWINRLEDILEEINEDNYDTLALDEEMSELFYEIVGYCPSSSEEWKWRKLGRLWNQARREYDAEEYLPDFPY